MRQGPIPGNYSDYIHALDATLCDRFEPKPYQIHSCTVVGNPGGGGGSWGFLANYFEGGTWGCEKIRRGVVFIAFLCGSFSKSL